jgi:hypothetical protein
VGVVFHHAPAPETASIISHSDSQIRMLTDRPNVCGILSAKGNDMPPAMYWVEIVDASGEVLLSSGHYMTRKDAEARRIEMQKDLILQSHPSAHALIRSELWDSRQERKQD